MIQRQPIESDHALDHWLRIEADKAIREAFRGLSIHGPMMSMHEGYAILLEEVDELWHELKNDKARSQQDALAEAVGMSPTHDPTHEECIQIAAVALRLAIVAHRSELRRKAKFQRIRNRAVCEARR